jgi:ribonuclease HII
MTRNAEHYTVPTWPDFSFEQTLWENGLLYVAGVDEAGRGALAGPVAAGVVVFEARRFEPAMLRGVRDSKQMTPHNRTSWSARLRELALAWGVGYASPQEIDEKGIVPATRLAIYRALESLPVIPQHLLVDFLRLPECKILHTPIVKGDARSLSIAAASILAKTTRDALMTALESQYPGYGFTRHKGYGTLAHRRALERLGPCPIHRRSFAPLKMLEKEF